MFCAVLDTATWADFLLKVVRFECPILESLLQYSILTFLVLSSIFVTGVDGIFIFCRLRRLVLVIVCLLFVFRFLVGLFNVFRIFLLDFFVLVIFFPNGLDRIKIRGRNPEEAFDVAILEEDFVH